MLTFARITVNWFCLVLLQICWLHYLFLTQEKGGGGDSACKQLSFRWMIAPQGSPATSATRSLAKGNSALKYKNP